MNPQIILLIGAGVLAYLWFQSQGTSLPSDAVFEGQVAAGTAVAVPQSWAYSATPGASLPASGPATRAISYLYYGPSEGMYYLVATPPTAAQTAAAAAVDNGANPTAAAAAAAPAPTPAPAAPASTPSGIAAIWAKAVAAAQNDANYIANNGQMSGSQWNFYISYVQPSAPAGFTGPNWPPEVANTSGLMTAAAYWALMLPEMNQYGLSGFRGMGAIRSPYWV